MADSSTIVTALELGSSKVVALMGELTQDRQVLNIIGVGECPSQGISKGVITDLKLAGACAHGALEIAEKNAGGVRAGRIFLSLTGTHCSGYPNEGMVLLQSGDGTVSQGDVDAVVHQSRQKRPPDGTTVVHYIQGGFSLDNRPVENPVRLNGRSLASRCWIVYAGKAHLQNSVSIINSFNLKVTDVIPSSLGSATAVTTREERRQGVLVVDIGAGTTDYVLYRDGFVVATGVIGIGGAHLTSDLAVAFRCTQQQAESLKLRAGKAQVLCKDKSERISLLGDKGLGDRPVPLASVERVCALRIEELFTILKERLGSLLVPDAVNLGAVLTGGSSQLPGIRQAASQFLGLGAVLGEHDSRIGGGDLHNPRYSTALGVLQFGHFDAASRRLATPRSGLLDRLLSPFKSS